MRQILLLLICCSGAVATENFPKSGKAIEDFAINGWEIKTKVSGDLNKDGIADYALEMRHKDEVQLIDTLESIEPEDSIFYHPTALLILFQKGDSLVKVKESMSILPDGASKYQCVTLEAMDINRGVLNIGTYSFMSAGSWWATSLTQRFRYQEGAFHLIGEDETSFHRASGDANEYSTNYLTAKQRSKEFNMFNDSIPEIIEWTKIPRKPLEKME